MGQVPWVHKKFPGFFMIYSLAAVNMAAFAVIVWLIKPFWRPIDESLAYTLGYPLPWAAIVLAAAIVFAVSFAMLARRALRPGEFPLSAKLFGALAVSAAVGADFMLDKLFEALEKDRMMLTLRAVECAPYVAILAGLALIIVVLPRLRFWNSARLRWISFALAALSMAIAVYKPWPPRIIAGPWLEIAANDGIIVSWITERPTMGRVEYGPGLSQQASAYRYGHSEAARIHHVTLNGLPPGEPVSYRVVFQSVRAVEPYSIRLGTEDASPTYTFNAPDPDAEEISFLLLSDLHEQFQLLPGLLKAADYKKAAFVVFNGDTLFQAISEYQVIRFLKTVSRQFASETPFLFIRGNHDSAGAFARNLPDYVGFHESPYAVLLDAGSAALLFLDTGDVESDQDAARLLLTQQSEACNTIASSAAWTTAPFRILGTHIGVRKSEYGFFDGQDAVAPDLQLVGHIHTTELTDMGFPTLIASGEAWFSPESYPIYDVHVGREKIEIKKILRTGKEAGRWEFSKTPREN